MSKVEAYECEYCGAVFKTVDEMKNCKNCAYAFCPEWGINMKKTACDECYQKRTTGTGSYMAPVEGKDPKEEGGLEKIVYSGNRCEYRDTYLKKLGNIEEIEKLPTDIKKIIDAMSQERNKLKTAIPSPEEASKLVKEGKGIIGDPQNQG